MTVRVAINGFGRIGRLLTRLMTTNAPAELELVLINDLMDPRSCAGLYKYDSVHGLAAGEIAFGVDYIEINGRPIAITNASTPRDLSHAAAGVDIVVEASGHFASRVGADMHLAAGARRVLISAPAGGADITVVQGVNHASLKGQHRIVSNASCTTNALAPIAAVLDDKVGIERGHMTTVHSYTNDQRLLDQSHPDLRRARGGAISMIPTSTGATKAVVEVLPQLAGKLSGASIRVPTPNVSLIDFVFDAGRPTSAEEINMILADAARGRLEQILQITNEPLVSVDFNHNPASAIIDTLETEVVDARMVRVLAWYDNEWGFANRLFDTLVQMAGQRPG